MAYWYSGIHLNWVLTQPSGASLSHHFLASPKTSLQVPIWLHLSRSFPQLQFSYSFGLSFLKVCIPFSSWEARTDCVQYLTGNHTNNTFICSSVDEICTVWKTNINACQKPSASSLPISVNLHELWIK